MTLSYPFTRPIVKQRGLWKSFLTSGTELSWAGIWIFRGLCFSWIRISVSIQVRSWSWPVWICKMQEHGKECDCWCNRLLHRRRETKLLPWHWLCSSDLQLGEKSSLKSKTTLAPRVMGTSMTWPTVSMRRWLRKSWPTAAVNRSSWTGRLEAPGWETRQAFPSAPDQTSPAWRTSWTSGGTRRGRWIGWWT